MKRQATDWKTIFANHVSDKGFVPRIYKECSKLNNKETNIPIKKWTNYLNRQLTTEAMGMAKKHSKICSTSFVIRRKQTEKP